MVGVLLGLGFAGSAPAAEFKFHGDLNNRFMVYTDQAGMFSGSETIKGTPIDKDGIDESWGEIKYRLWVEAATDDGKVKGVYAIELGAIRFGDGSTLGGSTKGGAFSGDGINVETRWAYTDFQLPGVASKARVSIGLIPFKVNSFVWEETAMGVQFKGAAGPMDYTLAWVRGRESSLNNDTDDDLFEDLDALLARVDLKPVKNLNLGLFALYQGRDPGSDDITAFAPATQYQVKLLPAVDLSLYTLGTDGSWTTPTGFGNVFLNWDLVYQGGSLDDNTVNRDVSAYLAHIDLGANFGKTRLTYTTWYASGDDNRTDGDVENFMSTDVDRFDSIIFFEGGYTDDNYFTEAPHILDKGLFFNKLAMDYKHSDKLTLGGALLYLQTAEDLTLGGGRTSKDLGTEIDAYLSYKPYPNMEIAINAGYLFADDGMDAFERTAQQDGKSDADVFRSTARVRYSF
ncbi:hypothetical protein [Candidatus Deferrimicrobium sp.]|uniref:hypothetical protein n=1 Tax=Candidatus Deferrimicrobium sp. TaxID=3060586 RepID=UPI002ED8863A